MHEWGIANSIIKKIAAAAKENGLGKVKSARLNLGKKLGIGKEEFLYCLNTIIKNNPLEGCEFIVNEDNSSLVSLEFIEGD